VNGAKDKWVEILASAKGGSSGGSFCVRNRFKGASVEEGEEGCTAQGDLIDIRESGNRPSVNNNNPDEMNIMFFAQVRSPPSPVPAPAPPLFGRLVAPC